MHGVEERAEAVSEARVEAAVLHFPPALVVLLPLASHLQDPDALVDRANLAEDCPLRPAALHSVVHVLNALPVRDMRPRRALGADPKQDEAHGSKEHHQQEEERYRPSELVDEAPAPDRVARRLPEPLKLRQHHLQLPRRERRRRWPLVGSSALLHVPDGVHDAAAQEERRHHGRHRDHQRRRQLARILPLQATRVVDLALRCAWPRAVAFIVAVQLYDVVVGPAQAV
mmetsp:Transcript_41665/g.83505  ORF Transcript_41665/g.83505 Transcript_41665/m.83505 type:complete len:228 (-) Transcript_41665:100-783(-)